MLNRLITEEQSTMIDYLIEGRNITDIAKLVGKSRNTIYKWLELDHVKEELEYRQSEIKKQARGKIASKVESCIDNLYDIATTCKDVRTKFQANKFIVEQFLGTTGANQDNTKKENSNCIANIDKSIDDMLAEINAKEKIV